MNKLKRTEIRQFPAPVYMKKNYSIESLSKNCGKNYKYAVNGRSGIYHILKSLNLKKDDKIVVPAYLCASVLLSIQKLELKPIFCDIDTEDLNISFESFVSISQEHKIQAVIVPSLYGNPANLLDFEKYCKENQIIMIDDGAQSFSSKLNGRYISTFGDGGVFSFSPGKATAGHLGAFFWTFENKYEIKYTRHKFYHRIAWLDFYYNRQNNKKITKFLYYFKIALSKVFDITDDRYEMFEEPLWGGILSEIMENGFSYRKYYWDQFVELFSEVEDFRILRGVRGDSKPHKIVLIFDISEKRDLYFEKLMEHKIFVSKGYSKLSDDITSLENFQALQGKILELPIVDNEEQMKYLFDIFNAIVLRRC